VELELELELEGQLLVVEGGPVLVVLVLLVEQMSFVSCDCDDGHHSSCCHS
jgi:hypothetical protein